MSAQPAVPTRPRVSPVCEPLEHRQLLAADLVATEIAGKFPDDLVSGTRGRIPALHINVNNAGDTNVRDSIVLRVFASTDGVLDGTDTLLTEQTSRLNLRAGRARRMPIRPFPTVPQAAQNAYRLIGVVDATGVVPEDNEQNNTVASSEAIAIGPPFINLTVTDLTGSNNRLVRGRPARFSLIVLNAGNTNAKGTGSVDLTFTPVGQQGGTTVAAPVKINVRSRKTGRLNGRAVVPAALTPGQYTVTGTLALTTPFAESVTTDNSATAGPLTVV